MRPEKRKKRGGEKGELKVKSLEFLLSVHPQTSQANIVYLDQKAGKCTTCKCLCNKFEVFIAQQ